MHPAVLIPAFEPDEILLSIVRGVRARSDAPIVLVDDGSGPASRAVFGAAGRFARVTVLHHSTNRGKGQALRTGMTHILATDRSAVGIVTADADGQHAVPDILAVAEALRTSPGAVVFGARRFSARTVPTLNRVGNAVSRQLVRHLGGVSLRDTQTGLRGIPRQCVADLIGFRSSGYEFEMEMVLWACARSVEIREIPIRTIYRGAPSHFRSFADSLRIAGVLARFAAGRGPARVARSQSFTRHTMTPSAGSAAGKNGSGP